MIRSVRIRTRISRALLIALVPLTICAQGVLAHASPVSQTFRSGVTLLSFSGTFEVVWPRQVLVAGSVIELRQLREGVNTTLQQATESAAVETNVLCPGFAITYTCARIQLTGIPELPPGAYTMYWRVVHLDDYVEQRTVRFTIDPDWVTPSPSPSTDTPSTVAPATPTGSVAPQSSPSLASDEQGSPSPPRASQGTPAPSVPMPSEKAPPGPTMFPEAGETDSPALFELWPLAVMVMLVLIFLTRFSRLRGGV